VEVADVDDWFHEIRLANATGVELIVLIPHDIGGA
jgi:hypothetical protein